MDEINDANDNLQEELRNEPQGKARVTYDDLWIQHKEQQMKNSIQKYKLIFEQLLRKINFRFVIALKF